MTFSKNKHHNKKRRKGAPAKAIRQAAVEILKNSDTAIRYLEQGRWEVTSQSDPNAKYIVAIRERGLVCTCEYHTKRNSPCKHSVAIEMLILQAVESEDSDEPVVIDEVDISCPDCRSTRLRKNGFRKRKRREPGQLYECIDCGRGFTDEEAFKGKHISPEIILYAMLQYSMGDSPKKIAVQIRQHFKGETVHETTIQRWADAYVSLVKKYTNKLLPSVGPVWSCDEKHIRAKGKEHWLFTVMDRISKLILSWDLSPKKTNYDPVPLFQDAKDKTNKSPLIFKTDKLGVFRPAFKKVFGRAKNPKPIHFWESHMNNEYSNNNEHERLNGTLGELLHGVRGLKKTESTRVDAVILYYNFIRPHMALNGDTPAKRAGIIIRGHSIWHTLIQNAVLDAA